MVERYEVLPEKNKQVLEQANGVWVKYHDYAALEQELVDLKEKHKKQLKQTRLGVDDYCKQYDAAFTKVEQERDGLKAMVEELRVFAKSFDECSYGNAYTRAGRVLNKTSTQCLAEVEARAVESLVGTVITDGADRYLLKQHAKQLREEAS